LVRLQQVSVDPRILGGSDPGAKLPFLVDLVKSTSQKVVVFTTYASAAILAHQDLARAKVSAALLTGDTPHSARNHVIGRFQTDARVRVFVTTIQAGGPGIDLTAGSVVVFVNRHYTPAMNDQAQARVDRIGQNLPITVYNLRTENSVDDHVYDVLGDKEESVDNLLDVYRIYANTLQPKN